jgi:ATP-dependent Lon protease
MTHLEDLDFHPEQFSGRVRLFPLPNLVLFPHVMQPLHIFEPRYRALLADALAGDRLIAMTLLAPGWETDYEGRPPLLPVGCLTRVAMHQKQPDDRSNVLLLGLRRIRLVRELAPVQPFREAEVEIVEDQYSPAGAAARPALQQSLVKAFKRVLPQLDVADQLEQLLGNNLPLGALTDVVGYAIDLDAALKQSLLAEPDVDRRAHTLLDHLNQSAGVAANGGLAGFPPQFSMN